ncbi:alpha/beta hydrolase, partial [Chromobacterium violaceum]
SAAAVALNRPDAADGLLLTSSIEVGRGSLAGLPLERLAVPVLMIQHRRDECRASRPGNLGPVLDRLRADAPRELMLLDGGGSEGDPCQPWAWHGYNGIERRVLGLAGAWMLAHGRH